MTTSFALCCGCYTCFNYSKGGSLAKALLFHQLCWWFFLALGAQKRLPGKGSRIVKSVAYSAAGALKVIMVAPVMASADSRVIGASSMDRVVKVPT